MKYNDILLYQIALNYGSPPLKSLTRNTINILEYLDFGFYDPVWYWDTLSREKGEALPGRWLRISHKVGAGMCYWVLNKQVNVIS